MPKPSRWTVEKRYEIVMETIRGKEPITAIARKHQVSDAIIHKWRERFYEGGKEALNFESGGSEGLNAEKRLGGLLTYYYRPA